MKHTVLLATTLGILALNLSPALNASAIEAQTILSSLLTRDGSQRLSCRGELVCSLPQVPNFYRQRNYRPAWSEKGQMLPAAFDLLATLQRAPEQGLVSDEYHLIPIKALWAGLTLPESENHGDRARRLAELDILLTDAFLLFADHLRSGRVNPETIHTAWIVRQAPLGSNGRLTQHLTTALRENSISATLTALAPPHAGYHRLNSALNDLRELAKTTKWVQIPAGPTLHPGDRDPRIPLLRSRLMASGDLAPESDPLSSEFDISLMTAVGQFQRRHGLKADGVVGRETRAALNVPLAQRIRQVELNLERWRWIPHDLGYRHIRVNIADFKLQLWEAGTPVLEMKVVVGRDYRKTPVFSETMKYLVFNPYWNVPFSIAVKDKLPLIQSDPTYLTRNHFRVFASWQQDAREVDPASVDWSRLNPSNFRMRLRQEPGPHNALGQIKFMFPNPFAVYLHDTSEPGLFSREVRTFSSGCIRIADPVGLAAYLLQNQPPWSRWRIQEAIDSRRQRVVHLQRPMPIHLLYWTAWVAPDGVLQFRNDIYHRDPPLDQALRSRATPPGISAG